MAGFGSPPALGFSRFAKRPPPLPTRGVCSPIAYNNSKGRTSRPAGPAQCRLFRPAIADYETRTRHIGELYGMVEDVTLTKPTQEWLDALIPLSIPCVKLNRLDDLPTDPHLSAVGFFETYEHPDVGAYKAMKPPLRFSKTPANIRRHPPRLGEHTDELLEEAGE